MFRSDVQVSAAIVLSRTIRSLLIVASCSIVLTVGCVRMNSNLALCPLAIDEQQEEILRIVPIGTDRDLASRKLGEAGIEFTPSASVSGRPPRTLYLDTWTQLDGERWAMDVAMLFDESGKLYAVRQRDLSQFSGISLTPRDREAEEAAGATDESPTGGDVSREVQRPQTGRGVGRMRGLQAGGTNDASNANVMAEQGGMPVNDDSAATGRGGWQPMGASIRRDAANAEPSGAAAP